MSTELKETRALWIEYPQDAMLLGNFNYDAVKKMIDECKELGANTLFWLIKARVANTASVLWYPSEVGPSHPSCQKYDGLRDGIQMAHEAGIQVHAYFSVFPEGDPNASDLPEGEAILAKHPEWAVVDSNGKSTVFVCAAHEGYRNYLLKLIDEVIEKYDFDGIHLDFIRYPRSACYCSHCQTQLKERFNLTVEGAQALIEELIYTEKSYDERASNLHEADSIIDYYNENVHQTVVAISNHLRSKHHEKYLSAAVFPNPRSTTSQVYCDWVGFSQYLDFVCPMVYWYSEEYFERTVSRMKKMVEHNARLIPGISALGIPHSLSGKNSNFYNGVPTFDYVSSLVEKTRDISTGGFSLFHHSTLCGYPPGPYTGKDWGTPLPEEGRERFLKLMEKPAKPAHTRKNKD